MSGNKWTGNRKNSISEVHKIAPIKIWTGK